FVAFVAYFLLPEYHIVLTQIIVFGLFALSLDLILGYAGIISVGHAAFFGAGGYIAAHVAKHEIIPEPMLALVASGLGAAALAFPTAYLVARGSSLHRLTLTLAFAALMSEVVMVTHDITGGSDGLSVDVKAILGIFPMHEFLHGAYVYCLIVLFVLFILARAVVTSRYYLSIAAKRDNSDGSLSHQSINIRLSVIYVLASFYAGVAGALQAQAFGFIGPDAFSLERSVNVLFALVIGGMGYLYGGLIGAVIFELIQLWVSNLAPQYWQLLLGLGLVIFTLQGFTRRLGMLRAIRAGFGTANSAMPIDRAREELIP